MHQNAGEAYITLCSTDVRQLFLDQWDWSDKFLISNSVYSDTSARLARDKGLR